MVTLLTDCAAQQDFIDLYEMTEAIEITNLCDELSNTINTAKLQAGLNNATELVNSRYLIASDCGRALIKTSCKQLVLWIARYLMDTTKSRPMVNEDYDRAMDFLRYACEECAERCPLSREDIEDILGENISTRTRLRCSSGKGNVFNRRRFPRRVKVDRYSIKDGVFPIDFANDRYLRGNNKR